MIKEYIITGKGYYKTMVNSPLSVKLEMCDIEYKRGIISFKGTEEQLETFIESLIEDETDFKYDSWYEKEEYNNLERIYLL